MPHKILKLSVCACLALAAKSQTPPAQPAPATAIPRFEVASVKPSQTAEGPGRGLAMARMLEMMPVGTLPMPDPGWVRIQGWPLRHVVAAAYRLRRDKVSGPAWMEDVNFNIEAKLPEGADRDQAHEMLQTLLADRFGVVLHRERRESAGFALLLGKHGAKLEGFVPVVPPAESRSPEDSQAKQKEEVQERLKELQKQLKSGARMAGRSRSTWIGITTTQLAEHLTSMAGGPVVDETGIDGKYNVSIETWRATEDEPEQTVFDAVQKLGLKLMPRKVQDDILVIDKVSKTPTAN